MRPIETLHWGSTPGTRPLIETAGFLPLGLVGSGTWGSEDLPRFDSLAGALAETGAEAVVLGGSADLRAERVIEALALDLHVLVEPPLADLQRCVVIAQNRGVRLMLAEPAAYRDSEALAGAFARYVLEGEEPPTSGRRGLGGR